MPKSELPKLDLVASNPISVDGDQHRQKRFQLARLLRHTEQMLVCAQEEDWESVDEMDVSRKSDISACFLNCDHEDTPVIAEALATLIYLNAEISKLVRQAKAKLLSEQQALQGGKNVALLYQEYC